MRGGPSLQKNGTEMVKIFLELPKTSILFFQSLSEKSDMYMDRHATKEKNTRLQAICDGRTKCIIRKIMCALLSMN